MERVETGKQKGKYLGAKKKAGRVITRSNVKQKRKYLEMIRNERRDDR